MFGQRIKELRKKIGLSQEELGQHFSISGPAVSKWESGDSEPDNKTLLKLSDFFGVSVDYLLRDSSSTLEKEEMETLKRLLVRNEYMKADEDLSKKELERLIKMIKNNKEFLKERK